MILYVLTEEVIDERIKARDSLRYNLSKLLGDAPYIKFTEDAGESNDEPVVQELAVEAPTYNGKPPPLNHNYTPQDENGYQGLPFGPAG